MIILNFPATEADMFRRVASELNVSEEMRFFGEARSIDASELIAEARRIMTHFPRLIILNLDGDADRWRALLSEIKAHKTWRFIPVLGMMSNESQQDIADFYAMRGASFMRKPDCHEALLQSVRAAVDYWLGVSHLPSSLIGREGLA